jgi:NAD kinase
VLRANEQAVFTTLRTRLCCEVYRADEQVATHQAFNEACLDRGLGLNFLQMDCYIDGSYVTTIQVQPTRLQL